MSTSFPENCVLCSFLKWSQENACDFKVCVILRVLWKAWADNSNAWFFVLAITSAASLRLLVLFCSFPRWILYHISCCNEGASYKNHFTVISNTVHSTEHIKTPNIYYFYYLLQLSFHSVAAVLALVTNKNKYEQTIQKHSKYKYTYYQTPKSSRKF